MSDRYKSLQKFIPTGLLESFILSILKEEPMHGYRLMKKIKEKTGFWKPSTGTLYPALHSLLKRGIVKEIREGRRKKYRLTGKGLKIASEILNRESISMILFHLNETLKIVFETLDVSKKEQKIIEIIKDANLKLKKLKGEKK